MTDLTTRPQGDAACITARPVRACRPTGSAEGPPPAHAAHGVPARHPACGLPAEAWSDDVPGCLAPARRVRADTVRVDGMGGIGALPFGGVTGSRPGRGAGRGSGRTGPDEFPEVETGDDAARPHAGTLGERFPAGPTGGGMVERA